MSTITSINHFNSPEKLVAYAELDPKVRQSSTWSATTIRMSKRENKLLRYAIIWASYNMTRKDGPMKDYFIQHADFHFPPFLFTRGSSLLSVLDFVCQNQMPF